MGAGGGWVGEYLRAKGCNYLSIDVLEGADILGDIQDWQSLGLEAGSFDVIVAFEVVEHVACWQQAYDLLRPGGKFLATSPVPHMDWFMRLLELLKLNQPRTSPHDKLIYFRKAPYLTLTEYKVIAFLSQWGVFTKPVDKDPTC